MKNLLLALSIMLTIVCNSQTTMNFRGFQINIDALAAEVKADLQNSIIANTLEEGKAPYLVASFTSRFSNNYLIEILKGDVSGKDTNVVRLVYVLYSTDIDAKTEIVSKLLYLKNKAENTDLITGTTVTAYYNFKYLITGKLLAVNKPDDIAIIEFSGNLYKCNYYTIIR